MRSRVTIRREGSDFALAGERSLALVVPPDEAVKIVLDNDASGAQKEPHQKRMMGEINKLTAGSNGKLDPADYERTVTTLLGAGGEQPVISKKPEGAWSHVVIDAALK